MLFFLISIVLAFAPSALIIHQGRHGFRPKTLWASAGFNLLVTFYYGGLMYLTSMFADEVGEKIWWMMGIVFAGLLLSMVLCIRYFPRRWEDFEDF